MRIRACKSGRVGNFLWSLLAAMPLCVRVHLGVSVAITGHSDES